MQHRHAVAEFAILFRPWKWVFDLSYCWL